VLAARRTQQGVAARDLLVPQHRGQDAQPASLGQMRGRQHRPDDQRGGHLILDAQPGQREKLAVFDLHAQHDAIAPGRALLR